MNAKHLIVAAGLVISCSAPDDERAPSPVDVSRQGTSSTQSLTFCPLPTVKQCHGTVCVCVKPPLDQIRGTVSGLTGQGLTLISDGTVIGVSQNGPVSFAIPDGQLYGIEVKQQPTGQACTVTNGTGYAPGGPFTVTCGSAPHTVSGSIEGLEPSTIPPDVLTLTLDTSGAVTTSQAETSDGPFAFPTTLADGADYEVTVSKQPPGQICTVWNGNGVIHGADVADVVVRCGAVSLTPFPSAPPQNAYSAWLMQDGTVLAQLADGQTLYRLTPDAAGSYLTGTWSPAGSLLQSQLFMASQLLPNGNLAMCGGEYTSLGGESNYCEIYDPFLQTGTVLAPPPGWGSIGDSPSSVLPNGQMVMGNTNGAGNQSAILDPATLTWTFVVGDSSNEQGYALLPTGDVLMTNVYDQTSKRYSPGSSGFVRDQDVPVVLGAGSEIGPSMMLANGTLIWFGASGHTAIYTPTLAGQNGTWRAGPDLPRYLGEQLVSSDAFAVLEPTGRVLLSVSGPTTGSQLAEYDPALNAFALLGPAGPVNFATNGSPLLLLPDGHALFAAWNVGYFDVQFAGPTLPAPAITSFPSVISRGTTVTLAGTGLCGLSEVSMMGDDNQQAENYPMVRVSRGGTTRYLRAHDVSTRSIAPGQPSTVLVDVPADLAPGTVSLAVVSMGVASAGVTVQVQ